MELWKRKESLHFSLMLTNKIYYGKGLGNAMDKFVEKRTSSYKEGQKQCSCLSAVVYRTYILFNSYLHTMHVYLFVTPHVTRHKVYVIILTN